MVRSTPERGRTHEVTALKMLGSGVFASLLLLLLLVAAPAASAQDQTPGPSIPHVLRPDDTSSPRQTLTRFLRNAREAIESYEEGTFDEDAFWAHRQLTMALDFSTTPHSGSWTVRTERVLQLFEILERIPLPPAGEIPGDREVADGRITKWFVPGTRIKISRIESGLREGEFLFSSETVERLESHYRMIRHLPGKPGSFAGFYETYMQSERTAEAREGQVRNRLKGIDMSSPRSTLDGFLHSVNSAYQLVMEADAAMKADPPTMTRQEAIEVDIMAGNLLSRAAATLDLRQVPEAHRAEVGLESVLQLKEIFDRMLLPPLAAIPNEDMVDAARRGEGRSHLRPGSPYRWKYPNTEFEIIENMEGDNQGSFFFSDETVSRLHADFLEVRDLPYRTDTFGTPGPEYLAPDKTEGFYDYYISAPGYMVPGASLLGSLVDRLPEWTHQSYEDQALWQWAGLLLSLLAAVLVSFAVFFYILRLEKGLREPYRHWVRVLAPVVLAVFVMELIEFLNEDLNITGELLPPVKIVGGMLVTLLLAVAADWICQAIAENIIISPRIPDEGINASLLRIGARVVGFLIAAWLIVDGIRDVGLDPVPLLAGLGVGGLAVALAAQKTVANFIGSLVLFANKPIRVGDFCSFGDGQLGTVEEINILSTRIRTLERSVITIPNSDFSEMQLDNYSLRYERRLKTVLQLRYETTPDQLRYVLAELRRLLLSHPMVNPDPARVRFIGYGAYSLDVEVYTYIRTDDHNTFLAIQEDILLRMADIVREAGSGFAYPSQTAYLGRDAGLDEEQGRAAEARVQEWRTKGELPFPEYPESEQRKMEGALAYPPEGSPSPESDEPDEPDAPA